MATTPRRFEHIGDHAGLAIFEPRNPRDLKMQLLDAVGCTVDMFFSGVAEPGERYAGQNLYQEAHGGQILHSSWIPEEDLRFLVEPGPAR